MAAPIRVMRLGISQASSACSFGTTCWRYMSRYRRRAVAVLTPEDESRKIVKSDNVKIRDPKEDKNIDYGYAANDSVLDTLSIASRFDEQKDRLTERNAFYGDVSKSNQTQRSKFGNKLPSLKTNASFKKFGDDEKFSYRKHKTVKSDTNNLLENQKEKTPKKKLNNVKKTGKFPPVDKNQDKSFHWDLDGMKYSLLKDGDRTFGRALKDVKSKNQRDKHQQILLEGRRLIEDGLKAGGNMLALFFTHDEALLDLTYRNFDAPIYKVYRRHMNIWSDTVTPPGILAIFEMPEPGHVFQSERKTIPLTLVLDKIKDPGNMGTLIRTAAAVGCQSVITVKGCVDVWDPKVVRSGAGCHFRVPIYNGLRWEEVVKSVKKSSAVYIADKRRAKDTRLQSYKFSDQDNYQQLLLLQDEENDSENDDNDDDDLDTNQEPLKQNYVRKKYQGLYLNAPIPVEMYNKVNFAKKDNIVLVVGGEIHGVSAEARKLAFDHYGECLTIPMCEGVESLNAAIAGSLLMYEVHRQISTKLQQVVPDPKITTDMGDSHNCDEDLHNSDEDLHTSDEELHTNDEDLHTSDEDLHTSDEDLHNIDEDLYSSDEDLHTSDEDLHTSDEGSPNSDEELTNSDEELTNIDEDLHNSNEKSQMNDEVSQINENLYGHDENLNKCDKMSPRNTEDSNSKSDK